MQQLPLVFPDRFDTLQRHAESSDLANIIVPVDDALERLDETYADMRAAGRGAFWVLRGKSGSGKSTFLHTVNLFREGVETISVSRKETVSNFLDRLSATDKSFRILVLENRESRNQVSNEALEEDLHAINGFIRSAEGEQTLVVWPCNSDDLQNRLIDLAQNLGADALLGVGEPCYIFSGPPYTQFLSIASRTVNTLSRGASLSALGVSKQKAEELVQQADTIGAYLGFLRQELRKNEKFVSGLIGKEQCRMWVVVIAGNDPESEVRSLTWGSSSSADIERLMVATNANVVQELKKYPEKLGILGTRLDARVMSIPMTVVLAIVRQYADVVLQQKMNAVNMDTRKDSSAQQRLQESELARAFRSESIGLGRRGQPAGTNTKEAFEKLLKITQTDDASVNRAIGYALKDCGLIADFKLEVDFGNGLTRTTDIFCETSSGPIRLEIMWRKQTGTAEIANYVLTKLYNYGRAIELLQ